MSDIKHVLDRLGTDVTGARLAPAAEVRRSADRRRRRQAAWGTLPAAAVVAAAVVWVPSGGFYDSPDGSGSLVHVTPATSEPYMERGWLPSPWRLDATEAVSMEVVGDDFCGTAALVNEQVVRQSLSHAGATVRIYAVATADFDHAEELRQRIWAQCGPRGGLTYEEEALYGRTRDGAPLAVVRENATVYVVVTDAGTATTAAADLPELVALMIHTVR